MKNQTGNRQTTQRSNAQTLTRGQFLDKKQLAALLGLSIFTIDSWVSQKREIPFVKMGKRVKFATEDVMKWIENNKQHPIP
ncbi:MAG: helix-turn-helix domain-containing protein [candidate division Zixibacteria bacterium]|nr:helix-turn-helix domain-containing protein [candidate division Zixibacteria bacterium]